MSTRIISSSASASGGRRAHRDIGASQVFDFDRECERALQIGAAGNHPVMSEQTRAATFKCGQRMVGQFLRAEVA